MAAFRLDLDKIVPEAIDLNIPSLLSPPTLLQSQVSAVLLEHVKRYGASTMMTMTAMEIF